MNKKKYEQVIVEIAKAKFAKSVKEMVKEASAAWLFQRQAIRLIDLDNNEVKGEKELNELLDSMNVWIEKLEILTNASQKVARRANQALHAGGSYIEPEDDREGHGDDTGRVEAPEYADKAAADHSGRSRRHNQRHRASRHGNEGGSKVVHKGTEKDREEGQKLYGGGL